MTTFVAVCTFEYKKFTNKSGSGSPRSWKEIYDPEFSEEILETITREVKFSAEQQSFDYVEDILKTKLDKLRDFAAALHIGGHLYPNDFGFSHYDGWHLGYFELYKVNTVTGAYERVFKDNIVTI